MGAINMCGRIAQNYALLDFQEGVRELANFTLALSLFFPIQGLTNFLPQMSAVMIDGHRSFRSVFVFTICVVICMMGMLSFLAFSEAGHAFINSFYQVGEENLKSIRSYFVLLLPSPPFMAFSQLFMGVVIKAKSTLTLTLNRALSLGSMVLVLAVGLQMGSEARYVLSLSVLIPNIVSMILMLISYLWKGRVITKEPGESKKQLELFQFFWPMALTTFMFTFSRPIIFNIVGMSPELSTEEKELTIAALSLAFAFGMIFHVAINQFRNVSVAFANDSNKQVIRFMIQSTFVVTALMLIVQVTPLAELFLRRLQGAEGRLLEMARNALWPLILVIPIVAWRNYYHGIVMNKKKTTIMGLASVARNVMIFLTGYGLLKMGMLDAVSACGLILVGFATEGALATIVVKRWKLQPN